MASSAEYQRRWRAEHPGYHNDWQKRARTKDPGKTRRDNLKANYGLTPEQYDQMYVRQGGRCAVCRDASKLCVDHDHDTGEVRALLCNHCNTALGHLREDPLRIRALAAYAEQLKPATRTS